MAGVMADNEQDANANAIDQAQGDFGPPRHQGKYS